MPTFLKRTVIAAAVALAAAAAHAQSYVTAGGQPIRSGDGECWRTGYWTAQAATEECDPQLVVKKPPMPAPVTYSIEVLFAFDDDGLSTDARKRLDDLAQKLVAMDLEKVVAVGHADSLGSADYNQLLSARRVWTVRDYLAAKGVSQEQLYLEAKGDREPVSARACEFMGLERKSDPKLIACLQPDRRVEVELIGRRKASE